MSSTSRFGVTSLGGEMDLLLKLAGKIWCFNDALVLMLCSHSAICEDHFADERVVVKKKGRLYLVKETVPTIYYRETKMGTAHGRRSSFRGRQRRRSHRSHPDAHRRNERKHPRLHRRSLISSPHPMKNALFAALAILTSVAISACSSVDKEAPPTPTTSPTPQ